MQIYTVGGAVRDKLLGLPASDQDHVVVGAVPNDLLSQGYRQVGHDFPVFLHPRTHEEYALARTERKSGSGYTGFICDFSPDVTLEEDLRRRDLTINAMAEDAEGRIIDPFGGVADLQARVLRHVSPAFGEDPLRVLRAARFAAKFADLGFTIAPETFELLRSMSASGELASLTAERVWQEVDKALQTSAPQVFISVLHECGALQWIMPEVEALFGVPGPRRWHPEIDTGVHVLLTLQVVSRLTPDPATRFAMLCHDLGKARTPRENWPHHKNHEELGVEPLRALCTRLHVPRHYAELAELIVLYHGRFHHLDRGGAPGLVEIFEKLDAYRRPQRLRPWLYCCKADFLGRRGFENLRFDRPDYVLRLYEASAAVTAAQFVQQGLKGPAVAEAVHRERVRVVYEVMRKLPENALTDQGPPHLEPGGA